MAKRTPTSKSKKSTRSRSTASRGDSPVGSKALRGADPDSGSPSGDLQSELQRTFTARESELPIETRIEAEKVIRKLAGETEAKAKLAATTVVSEHPYVGKYGTILNTRDEDFLLTYNREEVMLKVGVNKVPIQFCNHVGPGVHNYPGLVVLAGDGTETGDDVRLSVRSDTYTNLKREARNQYELWLAREIREKVGKYNLERTQALTSGREAPIPDPTTAFFMLKAKQYQGKLVA